MALWMMFLYGLVLSMLPGVSQDQTAYSAIGVVLFSFYLVYDVQLIVGGKHKRFQFSVDDHVFAAINVGFFSFFCVCCLRWDELLGSRWRIVDNVRETNTNVKRNPYPTEKRSTWTSSISS